MIPAFAAVTAVGSRSDSRALRSRAEHLAPEPWLLSQPGFRSCLRHFAVEPRRLRLRASRSASFSPTLVKPGMCSPPSLTSGRGVSSESPWRSPKWWGWVTSLHSLSLRGKRGLSGAGSAAEGSIMRKRGYGKRKRSELDELEHGLPSPCGICSTDVLRGQPFSMEEDFLTGERKWEHWWCAYPGDHVWLVGKDLGFTDAAMSTMEMCRICGFIRRSDDGNKPCRGPVKVGPR